jgi:hypothetical protein
MLAAFLGLITLAFLVGIAWALVISYPVMLLFGAVHSFLPVIPAFGYWQTLAVVLLIRLLWGNVSVSGEK